MDENQVSDNTATSIDNESANPVQTQGTMYTRDQLAKASAQAVLNTRNELESKYQRDMAELAALRAKQEQNNAVTSRDDDTNAIYQKVQERFNQEMQKVQQAQQEEQLKAHMKTVADNYLNKINTGKTAYQDFDEVTKDFNPTSFPEITYLLAGMDNAADVLYDLSKNPLKLAGIDRLAEKNPKQAQTELLKLSQSIMNNNQAKSDAGNQSTSAPLDRLAPSRVSGSNGKMSIKDLRNQSWLRG